MAPFTVAIYPRGLTVPPRVRELSAYAARRAGVQAARRYAAEELLRLRAEGVPGIAPGDETAVVERPGERLVARLAVRFREAAGGRVVEVVWCRVERQDGSHE